MRIRSIKPEFWRSKTMGRLDWGTRLVLKGIESYVDDNGVGKDDIALIAADVFPRDLSANPRDTLARLSEAISALETAGLIVRYERDGEELLYVDRWKDWQRIDKPGKGRFPRPDGSFEYAEPVIRESVARPPVKVAPVTGEQGNRGTGEQGGERDVPPPPTSNPFCKRHPDGTDAPCAACKKARIEWDEQQPKKTTPIPPPVTDRSGECLIHPGYPLPCHRCATGD